MSLSRFLSSRKDLRSVCGRTWTFRFRSRTGHYADRGSCARIATLRQRCKEHAGYFPRCEWPALGGWLVRVPAGPLRQKWPLPPGQGQLQATRREPVGAGATAPGRGRLQWPSVTQGAVAPARRRDVHEQPQWVVLAVPVTEFRHRRAGRPEFRPNLARGALTSPSESPI